MCWSKTRTFVTLIIEGSNSDLVVKALIIYIETRDDLKENLRFILTGLEVVCLVNWASREAKQD